MKPKGIMHKRAVDTLRKCKHSGIVIYASRNKQYFNVWADYNEDGEYRYFIHGYYSHNKYSCR